ncbi:MAG TPA: molybdopterin-dependent oxidoreductase [Methylocella sp.]|nr:molybdopterin-dependent oxidoreductase [Methylocella sp.]
MTLRTTCPYCGVGCGVAMADGVLRGDRDHPANAGRLCTKGAALKDTLSDQDRLKAPILHGRDASWDEALAFIAAEFLRIRETYGPDAIGFYVSGQFLTEDYYVANKLMKGFIGSANIDTNSRLCMASSVAGHIRAFGEDIVPGSYEDLEEADLVIQAGSNMAWCHPVLYQRLMAAREKRGTKIINIDPRRTVTAETADLHLPLRSGSDVALFNGLLAYLADTGTIDQDFINAHVSGFEEAVAAARQSASSVERVSAATGLPASDVLSFYESFARTERVVTLYSQGINQSSHGTDKVNAIFNCHLATGRIGRAGMGPLSLTGQPNAMGGREVGGLANQLAAHMGFSPEDIDRVRRFWKAPRMATKPGYKAIDLFEAAAYGRLKAIWIAATNPADSMPRAGRIREALARCPLVIVSDAWPTDTTALADVVLPASSWGEKDGTVTNSERCVSRQRAFRGAPGEARADWWMFAEVARRMGWQKEFSYAGPAAIFREHAALSAFENEGRRVFNLGGLADIDDAAYDALAPQQWPFPRDGARQSAQRLFANGGFPTPDGRARMVPVAVLAAQPINCYPLTLNTGRIRDQWHTMTRTGRVPHLMTHTAGPRLSLNARDAARRQIANGGLARVFNEQGKAIMRVSIDAEVSSGHVFAPMHWNDQFCSAGSVGQLVHAVTDPISGQPDLKGTKVEVEAVAEAWRGFLLRQDGDGLRHEGIYWSKAPLPSGYSFELSGWSPLEQFIKSEQALRRLLQASAASELISYSDPKKSVFRYASLAGGRLEACVFFAAPGANFPEAQGAAALLGKAIGPIERLSLLAGAAAGAASAGKIVCSCFAVGEETICQAIRAGKLKTATEIGAALGAGTGCGSCIPELKKLLIAGAAKLAEVA